MSNSCFSKISLAMWRVDVEGATLDILKELGDGINMEEAGN